MVVREVFGAQAQPEEGPIGLVDFPKVLGHGTFGLGWLLTSRKKSPDPRGVSSRQNLSVGFGVKVPDALNNAKVALRSGRCPVDAVLRSSRRASCRRRRQWQQLGPLKLQRDL